MFVTSENNRLPSSALPFEPEGAGVWGVISQLFPRDVLILRVSERRSRAVPTIVMMDLAGSAQSLDQFADGDVVVRGAAVLSTRLAREVDQWTLEPVSEIRIGVTEPEKYSQGERLMTVTRFTTATGRTFSVPYSLATRRARGRRLWRAKATAAARA
ncbi:hypothetical protein AB4Y45_24610 [Paraburkholderia sp. EG287A]|uniref:hypothetical protein n=1 Tax=unclassified Paraburkholderia TaxID=2615204 RepID=UPI0034D19A3A